MVKPVQHGADSLLITEMAEFESRFRYMETKNNDQEYWAEFMCLDCSVNTHEIKEYYMVQFELWESVVPSRSGMLCIGCLEDRLGRELTTADFLDAPINYGVFGMSDRFRDRAGRRFTKDLDEFLAKYNDERENDKP